MAASLGQIIRRKQPDGLRLAAGLSVFALIFILAGAAVGATLLAGFGHGWQADFGTVAPAALFTVQQAGLSVALSLAFALPVALALESLPDFAGRRALLALFAVPLALPAISVALAILSVFGRSGLAASLTEIFGINARPDVYGLSGILIAHVFFNMPLAVRLLLNAFGEIPEEQWKLAESLQFGPMGRVRHILCPVIRRSLPGIAGLIFLLCAGSYTIVLTLGGGPSSATLQVAIQQALSFDFDPAKAAVLTLAQLALTGIALAAMPGSRSLLQTGRTAIRRFHAPGKAETTLASAALAFAVLFLLLPLLAIGWAGIRADHVRVLGSSLFGQALATSLAIAAASALLASTGAFAIASMRHALESNGHEGKAGVAERLATGLLGIPPLLLGVGWFLALALTGRPFALAPLLIILSNALMALPFALQMLAPAVDRHFTSEDRLCASLGLRGMKKLAWIDWPVLRPAFTSAFLFAAALSLGDLGVVTLYGADRIITLPSLIYQNLGSYRSTDADALVLYLTIITGLMTIPAARSMANERD